MSLIKCPECRNRVSENASSCPQCGFILSVEIVAKLKEEKRLRKENKKKEKAQLEKERKDFLDTLDFDNGKDEVNKMSLSEEEKIRISKVEMSGKIFKIAAIVSVVLAFIIWGYGNQLFNSSETNTNSIEMDNKTKTSSKRSSAYELAKELARTNVMYEPHPSEIEKFQDILTSLEYRYQESRQSITDKTISSHNLLKGRGISVDTYKLMNDLKRFSSSMNKKEYIDYIGVYTVLRTKGKSHKETISMMEGASQFGNIESILEYYEIR